MEVVYLYSETITGNVPAFLITKTVLKIVRWVIITFLVRNDDEDQTKEQQERM